MKNYKIQRGMTLIETLITVAIIGIVASVMWSVFIQGFRIWRLSSAQTEVQRDSRRILDLMTRNIRQANTAYAITISRHSDDDPPFSKISFRHIKGSNYSYFQDGRKFKQTVAGNTSRFGDNVRSLIFSIVESGSDKIISIGLCLEKGTYEGKARTSKLSVQKVRIMN